jgi:hypothetical protein
MTTKEIAEARKSFEASCTGISPAMGNNLEAMAQNGTLVKVLIGKYPNGISVYGYSDKQNRFAGTGYDRDYTAEARARKSKEKRFEARLSIGEAAALEAVLKNHGLTFPAWVRWKLSIEMDDAEVLRVATEAITAAEDGN